jgi:hypothetical protein
MKFAKHVFISYGHVDNIATSDDEKAWVTRFHNDLTVYLSTNLGRDAEIWRDDRLHGNTIFEKEIVSQFPHTAALVTVLSRRYLESDWCHRELESFCDVAEHNGGLVVDNKARVLKVMLRPLVPADSDRLPAIMNKALGYEFYQEVEGSRFLPLDPKFGNAEAYHRNVYFLAEDVAILVQQLEAPATAVEPSKPNGRTRSQPVVYLAECSYDRAGERQKLRDELRANGYSVLPAPEEHLPELEAEYIAEVGRLLAQCDLSIHLIGAFPGKVPDGSSGKSAVQLQNEIAAQMTSDPRSDRQSARGLARIIWLPPDVPPTSNFLGTLTRESDLQKGADLIVGDFEELKSAVRTTLKKIAEPDTRQATPQCTPGCIYMICMEDDLETLSPVIEFLSSKGLSVELPVFSGEPAEVRQANEAIAMSCDAVIVFCGAGGGAWMFHQQNELKRVAGLRRDTPWRAQWIYIAGPATADKRVLLLKKPPRLVNALDGFAPEKMLPLIDSLGKPDSLGN